MKNIYIILTIIFSFSVFSQEGSIVPLNSINIEMQSGTYAKDINNELNPFVGTWTMIKDNIKYTLVFQKMEHILNVSSSTFYHYVDELVGKYETRDLNTNTVLFSTMNANQFDDFDIINLGSVQDNELELGFYDTPRCSRSMRILLYKMTFQPGTTIPYQLRYYNFGSGGYIPFNCNNSNIDNEPFPLPIGSLILTKQP